MPCDSQSHPCQLSYLLLHVVSSSSHHHQQEANEQYATIQLVFEEGSDNIFDMKDELLMIRGATDAQLEIKGTSLVQIKDLNVGYEVEEQHELLSHPHGSLDQNDASSFLFGVDNVTVTGKMKLRAIPHVTLTDIHSDASSSLDISISQSQHVEMTRVSRDPVLQGDSLTIKLEDITKSVTIQQMRVENKEFVTPLTISGTKILQSVVLDSCIFTNNQNGAVQISNGVRIGTLSVIDSVFDGNQGAGANAMFAIVDGAIVDKIDLHKSTFSSNTGYFNGGGFAVDYSSVVAATTTDAHDQELAREIEPTDHYQHPALSDPTPLTMRIEECVFSKNAAGPQQKGGSLYIIAPSSTDAYSLSVDIVGGVIEESTADQGTGGGIYMEGAQLSMSGGVIVQQNMAAQGAGVHLGKGSIITDANIFIRNNVADQFAGGLLFSTNDQVSMSKIASMQSFQFNMVKVGASSQSNPNVAVLSPSTLFFSSPMPLALKPYYPFAAGSGKEDHTAIVGFFVDSFGNAITLQSQTDTDATSKLYNSVQITQSDPEYLQFHETPTLTVEHDGFRVEQLQIIGQIGAQSSIAFESPHISGESHRYTFPISITSCDEGHLPTSVGDDATDPSQTHLKYCAFGDDPDKDSDDDNSDPDRSLKAIWRILALTVILLIAVLSFVILIIVGVIIRKNSPPVLDSSQRNRNVSSRYSDDDVMDLAHDDDF